MHSSVKYHLSSRPPSLHRTLTLCLTLGNFLATSLAATWEPEPIVATTNPGFQGYDGAWSVLSIRVGTPQQYLSLLPHTLEQETWVVGPAGCDGTSTCTTLRGGLFFANESITFQPEGLYELNQGDSGIGYYGLDTIHVQDDVSVSDQIIAIVNSTDQWIGSLGLGVQQTRFNGTQNVLPFLSSLVQNASLIPSHSYGYTAGASYRLKGVPASLVLGGVDANRFVPNNLTFTLSTGYVPVVAINSITVSANSSNGEGLPSNWDSSPTSLLTFSQQSLFTIDSSTPFLLLPESVCDNFAGALNLTYDEDLQLYVFDNDTSPTDLSAWNLKFTFSLGNLPGSEQNIDIVIPYDAFNLQLSYPFPGLNASYSSAPTNYFPLRRATNANQYAIGRAFLQESYLIVDYERNNFSISQAVFTEAAVGNVDLQAITRPDNSIWPGPEIPTDSSLSTAARVGIGVGAGIGFALILICLWFFCTKRRKSNKKQGTENTKRRTLLDRFHRAPNSKSSVTELIGDRHHPVEVPADSSASRFELSSTGPVEMAAVEEVSPIFFASREGQASVPFRNDPRNPVELDPQDIRTKAGEAAALAASGGSQRSVSPAPPYSPPDVNNRQSSSISPYTLRNSHGFGTTSSGEAGISPVDAISPGRSQGTNGSKPLSSPISPEVTSFQGFQDRSTMNSSNGSNSENLTVPQLNARPPSRSPSTGSRFLEQGLTSVAEEESTSHATRPAPERARFSWEQ